MRYIDSVVIPAAIQSSARPQPRTCRGVALGVLALLLLLSACRRGGPLTHEYAWVAASQVNLRDRVSALYNRVGAVKNGERVEVLERQKRFVRVRAADGKEGWVEQRYLVGAPVFDALQKLAQDAGSMSPQGNAVTRAVLNMHVAPGRDTDYLYQLKEGERIELLQRGTAEKNAARTPAPVKHATPGAAPDAEAPPPPLEDWWLARDTQKHVGWVLARLVDIDVPLDIAQYAEGQRIVAARVLNYLQDPGYEPPAEQNSPTGALLPPPAAAAPGADYHRRPQYLVLLTEPRDGLPFDYNQVRVFSWNLRAHRYETAYREHNLVGIFPVSSGEKNFGKEGTLPAFTLRLQDENGQTVTREYKLNGPMVRRVTAPGQPPTRLARPPATHRRASPRSKHR